MKIKYFILVIFICSLLALQGCFYSNSIVAGSNQTYENSPCLSNNFQGSQKTGSTYDKADQLILQEIKSHYNIKPDELIIDQVLNLDDKVFIDFVATIKNNKCFGSMVAEDHDGKYSSPNIDMSPVITNELVNIIVSGGHLSSSSKGYLVVTGYTDPLIKTVYIQYSDGRFNVMKLGEKNEFIDVTIDNQTAPVQIYGLDKDDKQKFVWKTE